eukprot:scaffold14433_cov18-Tisochrysis_lutea.AAC.1
MSVQSMQASGPRAAAAAASCYHAHRQPAFTQCPCDPLHAATAGIRPRGGCSSSTCRACRRCCCD